MGSKTLGDVHRDGMASLLVVCHLCHVQSTFPLSRLITTHGSRCALSAVLPDLARNCKQGGLVRNQTCFAYIPEACSE